MVMRFALDTNVVAEAARPSPERRVLRRLDAAEGHAGIPAPCWHELRFGIQRLPAGRRRDALDEVAAALGRRFPVLPYTARAAEWHAQERARLEHQGLTRPFVDGQIAAIAATEDLVLVTRNLTDFDGYLGLRVKSWWPDRV